MKSLYEISGYGIVLAQVQNYYPVELDDKTETYYWGFKYISGIFEFFYYKDVSEADESRHNFINALHNYLDK